MAQVDMELVREFAATRSEPAFVELVERHISLVHSAAWRQVGDTHLADEITQAVFIILARKAASLGPYTILSAWLYRTTRYVSADALKIRRRRERREQEAYMQATLNEPEAAAWEQLAPVLDEAMASLGETDRAAVVLRYFENKTAAEIATALKVNEEAAQKRVTRALEKLRKIFSKRGVTLTAVAIADAVSANSIQAAPAGLANSVSVVAAAKGATVGGSTLALVKGALKLMAWTKTKTAILGGAAILLATGVTTLIVEAQSASGPDIQGIWQGVVDLPGSGIQRGEKPRTRLVCEIFRKDGRYHVSSTNIDQGRITPLDKFTYRHGSIHAELTDAKAAFDGTVNADGTVISGIYREGTYSTQLDFIRTTNPPAFPEALSDAEIVPRAGSTLQGYWRGAIQTDHGPLAIAVKISEPSNGNFRADFYCPPEDENRQPAAVEYDGRRVNVRTMAGYGMFQGTLRNGNTEMAGEWIQDGNRMQATIARAAR